MIILLYETRVIGLGFKVDLKHYTRDTFRMLIGITLKAAHDW
jgi:hypothetical protein